MSPNSLQTTLTKSFVAMDSCLTGFGLKLHLLPHEKALIPISQLACDPRISTYLEWLPHTSLQDSQEFFSWASEQAALYKGWHYCIETYEGEIAGIVSAVKRSYVPKIQRLSEHLKEKIPVYIFEIATWIGVPYWGRKLGFSAKKCLLNEIYRLYPNATIFARIARENKIAATAIAEFKLLGPLACSEPLVITNNPVATDLFIFKHHNTSEKTTNIHFKEKQTAHNQFLTRLKSFSTSPALIYSSDDIKHNVARMNKSIKNSEAYNTKIFVAVKACYILPILQQLRECGCGAEVMSELEFDLALRVGFLGHDIICNGLNKSERYLWMAIQHESLIIVDVDEEIILIEHMALKIGRQAKIGLRLKVKKNANIPETYDCLYNKLGICPDDSLFKNLLTKIRTSPSIELKALHMHVAQNMRDNQVHLFNLQQMAKAATRIEKELPHVKLSWIDLGGGWAAPPAFHCGEEDPIITTTLRKAQHLFNGKTLALEPGRFLTHNAGYVVATVLATKSSEGHHYIIVNAGTNTLIPLSNNEYYPLDPLPCPRGRFYCSYVDGITSPFNVIGEPIRYKHLPKVGDRIIFGNCGAYTSVLAEFWAYDPMPIYFLKNNKFEPYLIADKIKSARHILLGEL